MKISLFLALLAIVWTGTAMKSDENHYLTLELGTKAMIACKCLSGNSSDARWHRKVLRNSKPKQLFKVSALAAGYRILTIDRAEVAHNGMEVMCAQPGRNVYYRLTVLAHDDLPRGFPLIDSGEDSLNGLRSRRSTPGDSVRLPCHATGDTAPDVTWYKDSAPIDWDDKRYLRGSSNHDLYIRRVQPEDNGVYECVARNIHGMVNSKPFQLDLRSQMNRLMMSMMFSLVITGIIVFCVFLYNEYFAQPTNSSTHVDEESDSDWEPVNDADLLDAATLALTRERLEED